MAIISARRNERGARQTRLVWLLLIVLGVGLPLQQLRPPVASAQATGAARRFEVTFKEVAPGLEYAQTTLGEGSKDENTGPWFINALRIDLRKATIKVVRALDAGVGMETVTSLAARHNATAAMNGGYFRTVGTYRGESLGMLVLNGRLLSEPYNDRAEFGIIGEGPSTKLVFGHLGFTGELSIGPNKTKVHGLNRAVAKDELIFFTPEFHRTTLTKADGIEVVVRNNRVVSVKDLTGSSVIPTDGYIVSAVGSSRDWIKKHIRAGRSAKFSSSYKSLYSPGDDPLWQRAHTILGGGPQLIKGGKIDITDKKEKIIAGFATTLHPRTALAQLDSGKVLLITVDGRQPGVSVGMSLQTLAELLLEMGAVEALNLDGGGSTTMVLHDKIVNRPSDQTGERPVGDAILVFAQQKQIH